MAKITLQDLASVLVERWHLGKKDASLFVNEMFFVIQKSLEEDKLVKIKGLGTFKIIDVDDRESVDVNTGDRVLIEGHGKITFTPDSLMKELVNKPFSQFETVVLKDGVEFDESINTTDKIEEPVPEEMVEEMTNSEDITSEELGDNSFSAPLVEFVTEEPEAPDNSLEPETLESPETPGTPKMQESPVEPEVEAEPELPEDPESQIDQLEPDDVPVEDSEADSDPQSDESELIEESETSEESDVSEENADETLDFSESEAPSPFKKYVLWIGIALATLLLGILIGYLMGNCSNTSQTPQALPQETVKEESAVIPVDSNAVKVDSAQSDTSNSLEIPETPEKVDAPEAQHVPQIQPTEDASLDQYEAKDARVRTGAYRILGTDTIVKAKAGDNITRICNRTVGKGMECYLEVYNGLAPNAAISAGQEIKIPKLELKKKKKKIE